MPIPKGDSQRTSDVKTALASSAVPALIIALKESEVNMRLQVLETLAEIGADSRAAVPDLTKLLADSDDNSRLSAAYAIG